MGGEVFAVQLDGVDADMQQQFRAIFGHQTDGVVGVEQVIHGCIRRGKEFAFGRFDGDTLAQCTGSKGFVLHLFHGDHFTVHMRTEHLCLAGGSRFGLGGGLGRLGSLSGHRAVRFGAFHIFHQV